MAIVLNSFLVWIYWTYASVVFAANNDNNTAKVTFFEDGTGVIVNGTSLRIQFDYIFTVGSEEGLNYTQHVISFTNGTRLM
jgi:hypothetical protein